MNDDLKLKVGLRFRLTEHDAELLSQKVNASGLTESEFLRQALVENLFDIAPLPKPARQKELHPIASEILYQISKQGNNVNQIAREIHTAKLAGTVDEKTYLSVLESLNSLVSNSNLVMEKI